MADWSETLPVGIIVERRKIANPWQDHAWHTVAVLPGAPELGPWHLMEQGKDWMRFHAAILPIELHRRFTSSYRDNLTAARPQVYVVLRKDDDGTVERPYRAYLATVAPDEAQTHLENGEDLVDSVPMPETIVAWVADFIERHHVEVAEYKRTRVPHNPRKSSAAPNGSNRQ